MEGTLIALVLATAFGCALGLRVTMARQQAQHQRSGLLGPVDPTGSLLAAGVLGAVPLRRVRPDTLEFEDGSGLLLGEPERSTMCALGVAVGEREIVLVDVTRGRSRWWLTFTDSHDCHDVGSPVVLDVESWRLATPV